MLTSREFALISALFALFLLFVVRVYAGHWAVALQIVPPREVGSAAPAPVSRPVTRPGPLLAGAPAPAPAPAPAARPTLAPTNEPPPRNTTDERGVVYDEHGVAIWGLIADPAGVHNVPPGRLVRIGGPEGELYEVLLGGKIEKVPESRVGQPSQPAVMSARSPAPAARTRLPPQPAQASPAEAPAARPTLAPTDEPPPRNTTDERGVVYDEHGVAVWGLIADPDGVHNVPPGRLVRIGGPEGELYKVLLGGKIERIPE